MEEAIVKPESVEPKEAAPANSVIPRWSDRPSLGNSRPDELDKLIKMDHSQRELRRAAAQAFMQSLGQLEQNFQVEPQEAKPEQQEPVHRATQPLLPHPEAHPAPTARVKAPDLNVEALEAAAADIEQFIQSRNAARPTPTQPPEA